MARWHLGMTLLIAALAAEAEAKLVTKAVEYRDGDTVLEGYLAYDDEKGTGRPGVVVVHDWMGLGEHAKQSADRLAGMGYVALAADVFGKGVRPKDRDEAAALAGKYKGDRPLLRRRMQAAVDTLRSDARVDGKRLAALGYCFGGTAALELARAGADVAGVVSFHGGLDTPAPAKAIRPRVLVLHGADDPLVPPDTVAAFQAEMRSAGADWQLVSYGGAVHSFTNRGAGSDPSKGVAYDEKADRRSWEAMRAFLQELFQ